VIELCTFNEIPRTCRPRAPDPVDPVHGAIDLLHRFSNRKINQKFLKITGAWYFYKNTPKFFKIIF
jgi:hypothetical protein